MADYSKHHHHQPQPLTHTSKTKSNHVAVHIAPYHHPPPPKHTSKCFVYTFAIFVLLCILLFISYLVLLRPKPLPLSLSPPSLKSLTYNPQSPAFSASFSAQISIRNPNFLPLHLKSASIWFRHGNSSVGSGSRHDVVVGGRGEEAIKVSATASAKSKDTASWPDQEKNMLRGELSSGVLAMKGVVKASGDVVLFGRISRRTDGELECDISIDLRSQQLLSFVCS